METRRPTGHAHALVAARVGEGDTAVDATAGNGHDTVFLAARVGASGRVFAFDVQASAIASARGRVEAAGFGDRVTFLQESHARMAERVPAGVAAVMFNLGYLPGGDHALITRTGETMEALEAATGLLDESGILTVVCYPGHPGGDEEAEAVLVWAEERGGEVFPQSRPRAPFLVVVRV